jgi:hypothetical protein
MAGDAYTTIEQFWAVQDSGDYTATAELFAEDAEFVDPIHGTFHGREAIAAFMAKMNTAVAAANGCLPLRTSPATKAQRGRSGSSPPMLGSGMG